MSLHILNVIDYVGLPSLPRKRTASLHPVYSGGGRDYLVCGGCRYPVAIGVDRGSFQVSGIICPQCGAVNDAA